MSDTQEDVRLWGMSQPQLVAWLHEELGHPLEDGPAIDVPKSISTADIYDVAGKIHAELERNLAENERLTAESEDYRYRWSRAEAWNTQHRAKLHREHEEAWKERKPPHVLLRWFAAMLWWGAAVFGFAIGAAISRFG